MRTAVLPEPQHSKQPRLLGEAIVDFGRLASTLCENTPNSCVYPLSRCSDPLARLTLNTTLLSPLPTRPKITSEMRPSLLQASDREEPVCGLLSQPNASNILPTRHTPNLTKTAMSSRLETKGPTYEATTTAVTPTDVSQEDDLSEGIETWEKAARQDFSAGFNKCEDNESSYLARKAPSLYDPIISNTNSSENEETCNLTEFGPYLAENAPQNSGRSLSTGRNSRCSRKFQSTDSSKSETVSRDNSVVYSGSPKEKHAGGLLDTGRLPILRPADSNKTVHTTDDSSTQTSHKNSEAERLRQQLETEQQRWRERVTCLQTKIKETEMTQSDLERFVERQSTLIRTIENDFAVERDRVLRREALAKKKVEEYEKKIEILTKRLENASLKEKEWAKQNDGEEDLKRHAQFVEQQLVEARMERDKQRAERVRLTMEMEKEKEKYKSHIQDLQVQLHSTKFQLAEATKDAEEHHIRWLKAERENERIADLMSVDLQCNPTSNRSSLESPTSQAPPRLCPKQLEKICVSYICLLPSQSQNEAKRYLEENARLRERQAILQQQITAYQKRELERLRDRESVNDWDQKQKIADLENHLVYANVKLAEWETQHEETKNMYRQKLSSLENQLDESQITVSNLEAQISDLKLQLKQQLLRSSKKGAVVNLPVSGASKAAKSLVEQWKFPPKKSKPSAVTAVSNTECSPESDPPPTK